MLSLLNNEEVILPEGLIASEEVFREVLIKGIHDSLNDTERRQLMCFLPSSGKNENEDGDLLFFEDTLNKVFEGSSNFKHGDPLKHAYFKLQSGMLSPQVVKMQRKCLRLKKKNYWLNQKDYYKSLLEEIILSRQYFLERAYAGKAPKKRYPSDFLTFVKERAKKKYQRIIQDISKECGDNELSSDEDGTHISAQDGLLMSDYELTCMLEKHTKKRVLCQDHPDMNTTNISLAELVMRCNGLKKTTLRQNSSSLKNNVSTPINCKSMKKKIKSKLVTNSTSPSAPATSELLETKKIPKSVKCPPVTFPKMDSFFSLIGYIFESAENKKCSLTTLEEKIQKWQKNKSGDTCSWKTLYPSWVPFIPFAIDYMSGKGTASQLSEFTPLLQAGDDCWSWTGPEYTNKSIILPLCNHWMDTLGEAMAPNSNKEFYKEKMDVDRTNYSVCVSSNEQKEEFRRQEKERFLKPYMPFVYTLHGYSSIAAPVKGVFKDSNFDTAKAREHAMLVSERPAYVTILSLVRDAVARLPNGEGTRAEVCLLLRDSQFLNPKATDSQVNNVVSGALDRLHAEKDPCVKFDPVRKVWLYLHRYRTVDELEKLHQASGAAVLAKKQLSSTKPKVAKVKKNEKEEKNSKVINTIKNDDITPEEGIKNSSESVAKCLSDSAISTTPSINSSKKKTAVKRKQSSETSVLKLPRLENNKLVPSNDLHAFFEDETLMATQSLMLSGERSDVFDDGVLSSHFLDIDLQHSDDLINSCNSSFQTHQTLPNYSSDSSEIQKNESRIQVPIYESRKRNALNKSRHSINEQKQQQKNSINQPIQVKNHTNELLPNIVSIPNDLRNTLVKNQSIVKKQLIPEQMNSSVEDLQLIQQRLATSVAQTSVAQTLRKSVNELNDQLITNNVPLDAERQHIHLILNSAQTNVDYTKAITIANKESLQNLSQFLTSKVAQSKVVNSSHSNSSITHNSIVRAVNVTPFSKVIRSGAPFPGQQQHIRVSNPLLNLQNPNNSVTRLVVQPNKYTEDQKATLKLIQVKGNSGTQIIASQPPSILNVRTSKNEGNLHLLSLNQLIASNAGQSKFSDRTVISSVSGACVPVASIQALLQAGQKSRSPSSPHGDQPQFIINHQHVVQKSVVNPLRIPNVQGSPIVIPVSNSMQKVSDKNVMNPSKTVNIVSSSNSSVKGTFTYFPGSMLQRSVRPTMAPLKITLPRSGFNSPQSSGNSPIRMIVNSPQSPSCEKRVPSRILNSGSPLRYPPSEQLVNLPECSKNSENLNR